MKTELVDRTLWFDGDVEVPSVAQVLDLIYDGMDPHNIVISKVLKDVNQYNALVEDDQQINVQKRNNRELDTSFTIPPEYQSIDVKDHVKGLFFDQHFDDEQEVLDRLERVNKELREFEKRDMFQVLRVLIYIIDALEKSNLVWGVGRGSSVASYVLYLLGVHDVDSFLFDLDITDFFRE